MQQLPRAMRDYRQLAKAPAKFLAFCIGVKLSLSDTAVYPDTFWGSNLALVQGFFECVPRLEVACHLASDGGKTPIRERDALIQDVIQKLNQIASILDAAAVLNPELLLRSGFGIAQERRSPNRVKVPLIAANDFVVVNLGDQGKAVGSASRLSNAFNQEIQANTGNPSNEKDWFHKGVHHDPSNMLMEDLDPVNTFFRMRYHGPDGPGPWSPVVTVPIT